MTLALQRADHIFRSATQPRSSSWIGLAGLEQTKTGSWRIAWTGSGPEPSSSGRGREGRPETRRRAECRGSGRRCRRLLGQCRVEPLERDAARAALERTDLRALVDALLGDGDSSLAWDTAAAAPSDEIGPDLWLRLAESREAEAPVDALAVYQRVADEVLERADRRAYAAGRANPQARSSGRAECGRADRVHGIHHARARAVPPTADPDRDDGSGRSSVGPLSKY